MERRREQEAAKNRSRHLSSAATGTWAWWQLDPPQEHSGTATTKSSVHLGCLCSGTWHLPHPGQYFPPQHLRGGGGLTITAQEGPLIPVFPSEMGAPKGSSCHLPSTSGSESPLRALLAVPLLGPPRDPYLVPEDYVLALTSRLI